VAAQGVPLTAAEMQIAARNSWMPSRNASERRCLLKSSLLAEKLPSRRVSDPAEID